MLVVLHCLVVFFLFLVYDADVCKDEGVLCCVGFVCFFVCVDDLCVSV